MHNEIQCWLSEDSFWLGDHLNITVGQGEDVCQAGGMFLITSSAVSF